MKSFTNWIRHHQVLAFFCITFLITWGLGFSYSAVIRHGQFLLAPLASIATCGPALAGIIVTAVSNKEPKSKRTRTTWIAFFIALGVSTLVFLANQNFLNRAPVSPMFAVLAIFLALPVAYVISMAYSRAPAVRRYLASLFNLCGVAGWAVLALVLVSGLSLLSILISYFLGRWPVTSTSLSAKSVPLTGLIVVKFLYQFFFFNGTGEEIGWRGFAWPRLQARLSPLIASLVMTFFWAIWHLFLWYGEGQPIDTWEYWIRTFVLLIPATVIIGWLYNRSKGSILVAGIAHAGANTTFAFIPDIDWPVHTVTMYVAVLVIIFSDRMWKKLPSNHPAVYQVAK